MSDTTSQSEAVSRLEEEGEVGADYLEELLDIADLGGDIDIDVDHGRASIAVVASEEGDERDLADLVGEEGVVLEAVQELTRLAVQARTGSRSRLMLDINGFRAARRNELTAVAQEAVTKVLVSGESVALEPMNPFERKVCHDVVAAAGLVSDSEGAEPYRHVVVHPADSDAGSGAGGGAGSGAGGGAGEDADGAAHGDAGGSPGAAAGHPSGGVAVSPHGADGPGGPDGAVQQEAEPDAEASGGASGRGSAGEAGGAADPEGGAVDAVGESVDSPHASPAGASAEKAESSEPADAEVMESPSMAAGASQE